VVANKTEFEVRIKSRLWNPGLLGKHLMKFERGYCFLTEPGRRITWFRPNLIARVDEFTLVVDTGFWRYGKLTIKFSSSLDADRAENQFRLLQ